LHGIALPGSAMASSGSKASHGSASRGIVQQCSALHRQHCIAAQREALHRQAAQRIASSVEQCLVVCSIVPACQQSKAQRRVATGSIVAQRSTSPA
jgi:hypothetical protein